MNQLKLWLKDIKLNKSKIELNIEFKNKANHLLNIMNKFKFNLINELEFYESKHDINNINIINDKIKRLNQLINNKLLLIKELNEKINLNKNILPNKNYYNLKNISILVILSDFSNILELNNAKLFHRNTISERNANNSYFQELLNNEINTNRRNKLYSIASFLAIEDILKLFINTNISTSLDIKNDTLEFYNKFMDKTNLINKINKIFLINPNINSYEFINLTIISKDGKNIINLYIMNITTLALIMGGSININYINDLVNFNLIIKNSLFIFTGYIWEEIKNGLQFGNIAIVEQNRKYGLGHNEYKLFQIIKNIYNEKEAYNIAVKSQHIMKENINSGINIIKSKKHFKFEDLDLENQYIIKDNLNLENINKENKDNKIIIDLNKNEITTNKSITLKDIFKLDSIYKNNNILNNFKNKRQYHTISQLTENNKLIENLNNEKLNNKIEVKNSQDILYNSKSGLVLEIKSIIEEINKDNSYKNLIKTQIKLEKFSIKKEETYLEQLIKDLNPILDKKSVFKISIIREWEKKINDALTLFSHNYTINNYDILINSINKNKVEAIYHTFILAFELKSKGILLNLILSIILRLLCSHNNDYETLGIKQGTLIMELINNLIKKAPISFPNDNLNISNNNNKSEISLLISEYYNKHVLDMSEETKGIIGNTLLDLILNNIDILTKSEPIYDSSSRKKYNYISIKKDYKNDLIERFFNPEIYPMIAPPKKWYIKLIDSNNYYIINGGYYTYELRNKLINSKYKFTFIKQNFKNKFETVGGSMQIKTINFLNNQKFKINKLMLEYLISEWNSNNSLFFKGLNKFHVDTYLIESNSKLSKYKKMLIESHNSKHLLYKNILEIAIIYKNINFYLPVAMDFRGRINPQPQYLHYHSSDLARCLIEFTNGCEINDLNINLVYQALANTAGKSKLTIKNKEKWAKEFLAKLNFNNLKFNDLNTIFNNPLIIDLINNTDEKGQFLSLLTSLLQTKNNYLFHTPICFDATCSGIQHLSAILSDIQLAKETNIIPMENNNDTPQDIYNLLANEVINIINNLEDKELRIVFNKILITRKLMKKPAMTVPYNVGLKTMSDQLISAGFFSKEYDDLSKKYIYYIVDKSILKEDEILILTDRQFGIFTSILFTTIFKKFPTLKEFKNYVDKLTHIILKLNKPLIWITPAPALMKISQSYRIFEPYKTKSLYSNIKYNKITISLPTTNLDLKKNKQAFMPNFIHSMDAANIQLLVNNLIEKYPNFNIKSNINLYTIHDCFATTPNFMDIINYEVKLAFIKIYFYSNYFDYLHNNFIDQIKSYTDIYSEINNNIETFYIYLDEKSKLKDENRIYLPEKPKSINWNDNKDLFLKGIFNSKYFIN